MEHARIVLIDYNEDDRRSTRATLDMSGHQVTAEVGDNSELVPTMKRVVDQEIEADVIVCNEASVSERIAKVLRALAGAARYETRLLGFDHSPESEDRDIFRVLAAIDDMPDPR